MEHDVAAEVWMLSGCQLMPTLEIMNDGSDSKQPSILKALLRRGDGHEAVYDMSEMGTPTIKSCDISLGKK